MHCVAWDILEGRDVKTLFTATVLESDSQMLGNSMAPLQKYPVLFFQICGLLCTCAA